VQEQRLGATKPLVNAASKSDDLSTDNAEVGGSIPPSPTDQKPLVTRAYLFGGWVLETPTDRQLAGIDAG
jgi:hypothetical protein